MPYSFETLRCVALKPQSTLAHPATPPELVKHDSPATAVMTSFDVVHPITTNPDVPIDKALNKMKTSGIRLLFQCLLERARSKKHSSSWLNVTTLSLRLACPSRRQLLLATPTAPVSQWQAKCCT